MLASIGMGFVFVPVTLIATSGVPLDDAGLASGLYNTSQQIGGALGLAILSTLSARAVADTLTSVGGQPTEAQRAQALVDGFHVAWLGSAALMLAGGILLFALLRPEDVRAASHGEESPVPV